MKLSRRDFVKLSALVATIAMAPLGLKTGVKLAQQLSGAGDGEVKLVKTFCGMCGALCGIQVAVEDGRPLFVLPIEGHPQQGLCGRSAATPWLWNHPLRIRKPLKRVGEKGEGRFQEIEWDQALNEIAAKLKEIAEKYGPRAIAFTFHDVWSYHVGLFSYALGTPSFASHVGTCHTSGTVARGAMLAAGGPASVDPDLPNASYVLLIGRAYSTANMGHVNLLRSNDKVRVVYVGPRMAEIGFGEVEWVPIKPATDTVFVLSLIHVIIEEGLFDADFLKRYTNAPFLIKPDGRPLTEADLREGGSPTRYMVFDARDRTLKDHTAAADPDLGYVGRVTLRDGSEIEVKTAFVLLRERAAKYPPEEAEKITGAPASTIRRVAREFALYRGVADDTWYVTWNGLPDFYTVMAILILNTLVGNLEKPGGLCWMETRRFPAIGSVVTVGGKRYWRPVWHTTIPEAHPGLPEELWGSAHETRIDVRKYPRTPATFDAILDAILNDDPYPVRALIIIGTNPIARDMDTEKVKEAFRKLELLVVVDVVRQDTVEYADYVLPDTTFLERDEIASNKWALAPVVQKQTKAVDPPPGCDARDWLWAFMEIIRRAWPEKAAALGWKDEYANYDVYKRDFDEKFKDAIVRALASSWAPVLRRDAAELYELIKRELDEKGYVVFEPKRYNPARLTALGTPSRKAEIYSLRNITDGLDPLPAHVPPAYTLPAGGDEFYLVNGKNALVSVHATLTLPMMWLHDRRVWMNPRDAERLGIRDGDEIEIEAIDTGRKARARVRVTERVMPGVLFVYAQSFGRLIRAPKGYEWINEGVNPHALIKAHAIRVIGGGATNCSVRVRKVS